MRIMIQIIRNILSKKTQFANIVIFRYLSKNNDDQITVSCKEIVFFLE
jgi:hypothetical protein